MFTPIRLIVGIGNPGSKYERTRHNAGERWVRRLSEECDIPLPLATRHRGWLGRGRVLGHDVRLLIPVTYVNVSGESVSSVCRYYKIDPEEVLVAYDEVAFPPGVCRLKFGGGSNGHNGIESLIQHFANRRDFGRLRIGVGHPGDPERLVPYLTQTDMPTTELAKAAEASTLNEECLDWLLEGDWQRAMTSFHTEMSSDQPENRTPPDQPPVDKE